MTALTPVQALHALAGEHGVATLYRDWRGQPVEVGDDTVRAVLAAMDVDASTPEAVQESLAAERRRRRQRTIAPTVVARQGQRTEVPVRVAPGSAAGAEIRLADGGVVALNLEHGEPVQRQLVLPPDLPQGEHRLALTTGAAADLAHLFVVPARVRSADHLARTWGWMVQLYALRTARSWGIGDLGSLRELVAWTAPAHGADFVLVNPLHAAAPTLPRQPSPYYPTSRRFHDPMVISIEALPEHRALDDAAAERVGRLAAALQATNTADRIDRDRAFLARQEALELLFAADAGERRRAEFVEFRALAGQGLEDFATWCVLAEQHGVPWQRWPAELHDPRSAAVAAVRRERAQRVSFHAWLQWCCDQQLAEVQRAARDAGAAIGVIHDLAVGVDPGGADAWALQDVLAGSATVGAPPDEFNRRGQDWRLPPLRPDRLAETGYRAFREILGATVRHSGGVRIDHALGLFRLYWIPEGAGAADGTYVTYPARDLLGILAMDAEAAHAVVIAEDLGTVPEGTTEALHDHGFLGSEVLYFARDDDGPLQAERNAPLTFASVTTHDLPTAAGWWADEAPRIQDRLGQLGDGLTLEQALEDSAEQQSIMRRLLRTAGVLAEDADDRERVLAMYRFLARTPSLLLAAWLPDAVGDRRQPNLPGTTEEYPNWRLPIAEHGATDGADPRPVLLEALREDPRVDRLVQALQRRG